MTPHSGGENVTWRWPFPARRTGSPRRLRPRRTVKRELSGTPTPGPAVKVAGTYSRAGSWRKGDPPWERHRRRFSSPSDAQELFDIEGVRDPHLRTEQERHRSGESLGPTSSSVPTTGKRTSHHEPGPSSPPSTPSSTRDIRPRGMRDLPPGRRKRHKNNAGDGEGTNQEIGIRKAVGGGTGYPLVLLSPPPGHRRRARGEPWGVAGAWTPSLVRKCP